MEHVFVFLKTFDIISCFFVFVHSFLLDITKFDLNIYSNHQPRIQDFTLGVLIQVSALLGDQGGEALRKLIEITKIKTNKSYFFVFRGAHPACAPA